MFQPKSIPNNKQNNDTRKETQNITPEHMDKQQKTQIQQWFSDKKQNKNTITWWRYVRESPFAHLRKHVEIRNLLQRGGYPP